LPRIDFGILSGNTLNSTRIALLAACVVSLVVGYKTLKRGFCLDRANILMFPSALYGLSVLHIMAIAEYRGIMIYLVLTRVAFNSLIAGVSFTIPYAKDMVDKSCWDYPLQINERFHDGCMGQPVTTMVNP
jgi:hypothetical protein